MRRYTSSPPSLKHEEDPGKMTDGGSQIFCPDQSQRSVTASPSWARFLAPPASLPCNETLRCCSCVEPARQIIKSHRIMCHVWPARTQFLLLKSVIQSTEEFFCQPVWEWREGKRQINSQFCSIFPVFSVISISRAHILSTSFSLCCRYDSLPSCGKGLLMNVDEHVGNVWASTTAFSLSDRSSTKALEAGLRGKRVKKEQTRNSFFPDGHCKIEPNILLQVCGGSARLKYDKSFWAELLVVWWETALFHIK